MTWTHSGDLRWATRRYCGSGEKVRKKKLHRAKGEERDSELTELLPRLFKQNKRSK